MAFSERENKMGAARIDTWRGHTKQARTSAPLLATATRFSPKSLCPGRHRRHHNVILVVSTFAIPAGALR